MGERIETALDEAFFALSHRARRRLLRQLADGPRRVTDLARRHRVSLNSVSKHIAILERAGLVERSVEGRDHFLALDPARLEAAERWLDENRRFWTVRLDSLAAMFQAKDDSR
jgi:DNA-binding transcriptional ArsR family regulator